MDEDQPWASSLTPLSERRSTTLLSSLPGDAAPQVRGGLFSASELLIESYLDEPRYRYILSSV
jgi:hypothetical protein